MLIKTLVIIVFLIIISSLGSALFHLVKHKDEAHSQKTLTALTFRVGLSVVLFIFIVIALGTGGITPTGIGIKNHASNTLINSNSQNMP